MMQINYIYDVLLKESNQVIKSDYIIFLTEASSGLFVL